MSNVVSHCMALSERKRVAVLGLIGLLGALAAAGVAYAATSDTNLKASVGSTAKLSLVDAAGAPVTHLDPGPVELEIEDSTEVHSFHLTGPGNVNVGTGIEDIETKKFALILSDGRYDFICDAHPLTMKGAFDVGNAPPPPHRLLHLHRPTDRHRHRLRPELPRLRSVRRSSSQSGRAQRPRSRPSRASR